MLPGENGTGNASRTTAAGTALQFTAVELVLEGLCLTALIRGRGTGRARSYNALRHPFVAGRCHLRARRTPRVGRASMDRDSRSGLERAPGPEELIVRQPASPRQRPARCP